LFEGSPFVQAPMVAAHVAGVHGPPPVEQADGGGFEARGSSIAIALHDEAEARGVPQSGSAKSGPCSIAQAAICVRELNPSFRSTLETWVSTVRLVILSSSAMRLLV
jgi:hypothetical protein